MSTINRIEDISRDDIIVGEGGLELLRLRIAEINKKATKWGLPEIKLEVLKEEDIKVEPQSQRSGLELPTTYKKQYTVKIEGASPQIQGKEFIAKVEHTEAGNLINIAPHSSVKELPPEYREANAECSVCKTKRDRFNTFVLKDEKTGALEMVGSSCLKRFLPIDDVSKLIHYAELLEKLRELSQEELEDADSDMGGGSGNRYKNHYEVSELIYFLSLAYIVNGNVYISKKRSQELSMEDKNVDSTAGLATSIMFYRPDRRYPTPDYILKAEEKKEDAKVLATNIMEYMKNHDFAADALRKPEMANYFNNLEVLKKSTTTNIKHLGYLGGVLASYLIEKDMIRKREEAAKKKPSEFVGTVGQKIEFEATLKRMRGFESQWGGGMIYAFEDDNSNEYVWFTKDIGLHEGEKYSIKATVKEHKVSDPKYGSKKQTILTRAKIQSLSGEKINEKELHLEYKNYFV